MGKNEKTDGIAGMYSHGSRKYCRMRIQQRYQRTGACRTGGI